MGKDQKSLWDLLRGSPRHEKIQPLLVEWVNNETQRRRNLRARRMGTVLKARFWAKRKGPEGPLCGLVWIRIWANDDIGNEPYDQFKIICHAIFS